jgi:hypothetical protein
MVVAIEDASGRVLVSVREAAEKYPCSMAYIRKLILAGRIYSKKIHARAHMVDLSEVLDIASRDATGREKKRSTKFTSN